MPMSIWGTRILSKREGKYFNAKAPSASISYPATPWWKWFSRKGEWLFYIRPRTRCLSKKLAANSRVFLVLRTRCASWWTAMHLKIQSSSAYLSSGNKPFLFRSQSGNRPAPICKGAWRSSIIFTSTIRNPLRFWALYVFALEASFFLFFQQQSRFRHSFKPGASFLKIGHCFLRFNVPKLIGMAVSHSLFDSANHLWSQIVVYIFEKTLLRDSSSLLHFILSWKFRNQVIVKRWKCSFRTSFQNINPLCWRRFVFFITHRIKGIKSFHPLAGLVSCIFLVPVGRVGWYALGKSGLRRPCFVSVAIGSCKIFYTTVWSDDSAFPSCRGHSTSSSVVKSALRAFSEAIMQTFCQSLICCSRSVCAAANAKNLFAVAGPAAGVCGIIGEFILEKKCPLTRQCRRSPE